MTHERAINLVCEATGYDAQQIAKHDDAQSLDLWDSIAHLNIIMMIETLIKRPITTAEIIELSSIDGIQKILDSSACER